MKFARLVPSAAVWLLTLSAARVTCQSGPPTRIPALVAVANNADLHGEPFMIRREPQTAYTDVIVLSSRASIQDLSDAIRALLTIREVGGDTASAPSVMRMRPHSSSSGAPNSVGAPPIPWAGRVLADARRAAERDIPRVGRARAVTIWLPPQSRGRKVRG